MYLFISLISNCHDNTSKVLLLQKAVLNLTHFLFIRCSNLEITVLLNRISGTLVEKHFIIL